MPAAVFGTERFQTYVYSRSFTIESDHKPRNPSPRRTWQTHQPVHSACYCASRATITPSITTLVRKWPAWTLSGFCPHPGPDILLDIAIHHACLSPERKEAFQQAFVNNPKMCTLTDMMMTGWPNDIKVVPHLLCPYWQHCETLIMEDGLVICGEALIISPSEREGILQQLYQFHQGTTKPSCLHVDVSSGWA